MFHKPAVSKKVGSKGFTLIEILVVIGIIAVLAAIVIVAINPARQFAQARDSQRLSNINTILNAIGQKMADNKGVFNANGCPNTLPSATTSIVTSGGTQGDLSCLVPTYMSIMPTDPTAASGANTGYEVYQEASTGRVHVIAQTQEPSIPRTAALEVVR